MKNHKIVKILSVIISMMLFFIPSMLTAQALTKNQAKIIAENYIDFEKSNFPTWENTSIKSITTIYSSNEIIVAYEVALVDNNEIDRGYIIVNTNKDEPVIPTFLEDGKSISESLIEHYNITLKKKFSENSLTPKEFIILGNIPLHFAIGVKFKENNIDNKDFISQDGWYIFALNKESQKKIYHIDESKQVKYQKINSANNENNEFREALLQNDKSSNFFIQDSSGAIKGIKKKNNIYKTIGGASSSDTEKLFSKFFQETRNWTKGVNTGQNCPAGCGAIAWITLLEYWDRNGYPSLVSSATDNNNRRTTDSDIRWSINELRGDLKINCQGSAKEDNMHRGEYHINSRGYSSIVSTNYWGPAWWEIISDIGNGRPCIIMIDVTSPIDGMDHGVVAYEYEDYWGNANDKFKVNMGWGNTTRDAWYSKDYLFGVTSVEITGASTGIIFSSGNNLSGAGSINSSRAFPGWSYCTSSQPCSAGYGDCDSDNECQSNLTCKQDVGAKYGWKSSVDVCEASSSSSSNSNSSNGGSSSNSGAFPGWSYCTSSQPCSAGYGDCDLDNECQSNLTCKQNVGAKYGWKSSVDVCE